jgi:integrase
MEGKTMAGSVRKTADGWIADVSVGGVRRTGKAKTKTEALARKRELLEALLQKPAAVRGITMKDARALSLRIRWAGKAYERTAAIYSAEAVAYFGEETDLATVTVPTLDAWRQQLLARGNRPGTANMKLGAVRSMMSDAVLHGHLPSMPSFPRQLATNNTRDRVITDQERDAMAAYFIAAGHPVAADMLVWLLETCCRWGEAEKLKGADVDLDRARVTFWTTKNGKNRSVPLTRRAIDAITPHMPAAPGHRVWPYSYNQFQKVFAAAKAAMGLEDDAALTIHSTRHTCASKLASRGVSLHQLMAYGGWTSLQSVQRYLHLHTDALAVCVSALEGEG